MGTKLNVDAGSDIGKTLWKKVFGYLILISLFNDSM